MRMTPVRALVLGLALLAASAGLALAQTGPPPFSCADTVLRVLGPFQGEWQVRALFRTGAGTWDTTQAVSSITPDLNGCVLREHYRGTRYGEPYEYLALWGANGGPAGPVQRFFTHSLHGIFGLAAGAYQGDTLVLEERLMVRGQPLIQQKRYSRPSASEFTELDRRSTDGGATWTVTLQAMFRRRVTAPR